MFIEKIFTLESALLYMVVFFIFKDILNFLQLLLNQIDFENVDFLMHYQFEETQLLQTLKQHFEVFIDAKKYILICLSIHLSYLALKTGVMLTRKGN